MKEINTNLQEKANAEDTAGDHGKLRFSFAEKLKRSRQMPGKKRIWEKIDPGKAGFVFSFFVPTMIMFVLFITQRIYPFGDRSFLSGDMYHQYTPFFSELLHKIRGGENLNFSFNVGIGSNFLALFVYYLASPFHIFSLLVPEAFLIEFMSYLIVFKVGLAGLSFYYYLQEHFRFSRRGVRRAGNGSIAVGTEFSRGGSVSAEGGISGGGSVSAEGGIPGGGSVSAEGGIPGGGSVSAEGGIPGGGSVFAEGRISGGDTAAAEDKAPGSGGSAKGSEEAGSGCRTVEAERSWEAVAPGSRLAGVLFACFYALSGFMAAYNYNIMWVDCVVLLPLILLGLERLVKERRCGLYCVTLALSIFTNYYISIMICIFLVLYFVLLLAEAPGRLRGLWKTAGRFALFSLLAGGMAAILLIPEVCAILKTDFGDMDFPKKIETYFSVLDMLARHCMCVYTERGLDHWPNIYCGSAVLMLMPMYLMNKRISIREKFCRMALAGFMLLGFSTNLLNFIWHGLNYPDSLPARQSFIYIFLVLIMCYDAWRHVRETKAESIYYGFLCAVGFILFCEKFVDHEDFELGVKLLTLVFVSIYAVLLHLYRTREDRSVLKAVAVVAVVAVVAESGVNTLVTSLGTVSRSAYLGQQADYKALYELTKEREESFYRLEKFTRKTKNDGTLTGYPTASVFSSTLNSYVMDMYKRLGMRHSKVYYGFDGATAFTSALLNVNYMFGESEKYENGLYTLLEQSGDIYLYQCNALLPFGYVAPVGFDLDEEEALQGFRLQNRMVEALGIEGTLFLKEESVQDGDDVKFTAKTGGYYYASLTASGTSKVDYIGGSTEEEHFKDLKKGSILYLGYLEQDQSITLTNGDEDDSTPKIALEVYRMDDGVLGQALELLSAQHMENVVWESDHITGTLTLTEPGRLICSIPYEAGWSVRINGEEAEGALFGGCLMAFDLEPGEYAFEMKYVPEGAGAGVAVSVVSIFLFVLIMKVQKRAGF